MIAGRSIHKIAQRQELAAALSLAAIIALAALLRTWQIDLVEFKMDESGWLSVASDLIDRGSLPQIGSVDPSTRNTMGIHIPPLMAYLMALPLLLSRSPAFATGFVALMNVLAVVLVYLLAGRYFGRLEGQTAALLYAGSATAAFYSRKVWSNYMLAPFVVLLFITMYGLFVERKRWYLAAALFLASWAMQLHISTLPVAAVLVLLALLFRRELHWKPLAVGLLSGITLWIPYLAWIAQNQTDDLSVILSFLSRGTPVVDLDGVRGAIEMVVTGRTEVGVSVKAPTWIPSFQNFYWFDYLFVSLLAGGVAIALKRAFSPWSDPRTRKSNLILLLWVILPVLVATRHSIAVQRFYMLPLQPALYILIGISSATFVKAVGRWSLYPPPGVTNASPWPSPIRGQDAGSDVPVRPRGGGVSGQAQLHFTRKATVLTARLSMIAFALALLAAIASQAYLFTEFVKWAENGNAFKAFGYPPVRYELEAARRLVELLPPEGATLLVPDDTDTQKVFAYLFKHRRPRFLTFTSDNTILLPYRESDAVYVIPSSQPEIIRQLEPNLPGAQWSRIESSEGELQFVLIKGVQESLDHSRNTAGFKSLSLDLANGLRIAGYQLPSQVEPGRRLTGLLFLEASDKAKRDDPADYHLFNHLFDQSVHKVAQNDSSSLHLQG
ncbi:MAG: glycosyltransferase family 39 protein, partial [Chloroflexi bacterium]|nr:glycosyltransferase family 39 protein [Chloroflexota bacterium]